MPKISEDEVIAVGKETGGYGQPSYVVDYVNEGKFPKIHDLFETAVRQHFPNGLGHAVVDIGACTGLLGVRAVKHMGATAALGFEPQERDIRVFQKFIKDPTLAVDVEHRILDLLDATSTASFIQRVQSFGAKTLLARRVISELCVRYGSKPAGVTHQSDGTVPEGIYRMFADTLAAAGFSHVVLQGRAFSSRSTHPIPHTQAEIETLESRYSVVHRHKDVAILRIR